VQRYADSTRLRVAEGVFTYVAIDAAGRPQPIARRPS